QPSSVVSEIARVERVEGEAYLVRPTGRERLQAGQGVRPGEGLETVGQASQVVLTFADMTALLLGGDTQIRDVFEQEAPAMAAKGKRLFVSKGTVRAIVARQPKDQPMIFV